jgi:hypothetical protein
VLPRREVDVQRRLAELHEPVAVDVEVPPARRDGIRLLVITLPWIVSTR